MNAGANPTGTSVFVVEDHPATRAGLCDYIGKQADMCLRGAAGDGAAAFAWFQENAWQNTVLLLDLNLPDMNGWDLLTRLKAIHRLPPTIVLSVKDERFFCRRLLRAGARGYLMKGALLEDVGAAIREVAHGHIVVSPAMATEIIEEAMQTAASPPEPADRIGTLSDRELQVLDALALGMRNKEIAQHMCLSEKTVATYKARLMAKLGVCTTPELIAAARRLAR